MAYSFACADMGADCPGSFTTETKDELLAHTQLHVQQAHPDLGDKPELAGAVAGLIKTV
jgi:predicted small metal-binding protein